MLILNIPIPKIFAVDLSAFSGGVPKGLEALIAERKKIENLLLRQKLNPKSLSNDERLELERLQKDYNELDSDLNDDKPFTDY